MPNKNFVEQILIDYTSKKISLEQFKKAYETYPEIKNFLKQKLTCYPTLAPYYSSISNVPEFLDKLDWNGRMAKIHIKCLMHDYVSQFITGEIGMLDYPILYMDFCCDVTMNNRYILHLYADKHDNPEWTNKQFRDFMKKNFYKCFKVHDIKIPYVNFNWPLDQNSDPLELTDCKVICKLKETAENDPRGKIYYMNFFDSLTNKNIKIVYDYDKEDALERRNFEQAKKRMEKLKEKNKFHLSKEQAKYYEKEIEIVKKFLTEYGHIDELIALLKNDPKLKELLNITPTQYYEKISKMNLYNRFYQSKAYDLLNFFMFDLEIEIKSIFDYYEKIKIELSMIPAYCSECCDYDLLVNEVFNRIPSELKVAQKKVWIKEKIHTLYPYKIKPPYWQQGGTWPVDENNIPLTFVSQQKDGELTTYLFENQKTKEIVEVEDFS